MTAATVMVWQKRTQGILRHRHAALALILASCAPAPDGAQEPRCTSGVTWDRGNERSPLMHPGAPCLDCHSRLHGPSFYVAGTIYPSLHEPDDCRGVDTAPLVQLTDASGTTLTLNANAAGNFYLKMRDPFVPPYTARITYQGRMREMATLQQSGDCNLCHTADGANGSPGRIILP